MEIDKLMMKNVLEMIRAVRLEMSKPLLAMEKNQ